MWFVYIITCKDKTLYTGMTNDIDRRFKQHKSGHGSKYVRSRGVKKLAYIEACRTKRKAMKREAAIKRLPREKKIELFSGKCKE